MALGKAVLTQVVLPVPRGPNRKKLFPLGGVINLEYIIPFYTVNFGVFNAKFFMMFGKILWGKILFHI